jgi:hypothetical protein
VSSPPFFEVYALPYLWPSLEGPISVSQTGALTPINQNAIKKGKCGNLECGQTERGKSERDKAHISVDPDFAQTDFAQTELAKTMFYKSGIP